MSFESGIRLFSTLRYLKPVQIYGRVLFRLRKPRIDRRVAPPRRRCVAPWRDFAWRAQSFAPPRTFSFLNVTRELRGPEDWNNPQWDKLWLYNLHYFDDLVAQREECGTEPHVTLIERWIRDNPPVGGNGWEPYPLSLRIVNWIKWSLKGNALDTLGLDSLALQLRVLSQRIEWHLLGNHLLANAKALVFGGLYFEGPEAERWLRAGLDILRYQVPEQVLADGGHFERSPMYHAIVLEDLLDLVNVMQTYATNAQVDAQLDGVEHLVQWRASASAMLPWLAIMTHPDREIALMNDAAFDIAPRYESLHGYATSLGIAGTSGDAHAGLTVCEPSGYFRAERANAVLIGDVGEIGPDYLPGHAHADTLSFELSLFGQRFIVDSGTSVYGVSDERLRQRGTAAHNTVVINEKDSSEVWSGFRVGRRARPFGLEHADDADVTRVLCAHDGYQRFGGKPVHRREWCLTDDALTVTDCVNGHCQSAVAVFHFHPDVSVEQVAGDSGAGAAVNGETKVAWHVTGGHASLTKATYHPRFGASEMCHRLEVRLTGDNTTTTFRWS